MNKRGYLILLVLVSILAVLLGMNSLKLSKELKELNEYNKHLLSYENIDYDADTLEEINELRRCGKPIIIALGADYCPSCISYRPYIKELNRIYGDDIIIRYVDTVKHEKIRKQYNIELIPSTLFYEANGNIYSPNEDIDVHKSDEEVEEYRYVADDVTIIDGTEIGANTLFEYGELKDGELIYCKYVGLLEMLELEQIAKDLISHVKGNLD